MKKKYNWYKITAWIIIFTITVLLWSSLYNLLWRT